MPSLSPSGLAEGMIFVGDGYFSRGRTERRGSLCLVANSMLDPREHPEILREYTCRQMVGS